jgi:hypothetical protein
MIEHSKSVAFVLAAIVAVAVLAGCGATTEHTTTVVTIVKEQPAANGASEQVAPTDDDDLVDDEGTGATADDGDTIRVPNEVGKNHQAAQDDLQAHGLYNLAEEDATGDGRMLILDRGWHVVSQTPAAGAAVASDTTITLRSKKYTDP